MRGHGAPSPATKCPCNHCNTLSRMIYKRIEFQRRHRSAMNRQRFGFLVPFLVAIMTAALTTGFSTSSRPRAMPGKRKTQANVVATEKEASAKRMPPKSSYRRIQTASSLGARKSLNRKSREQALTSIWYHTKPDSPNRSTKEALMLLELLLKDEKENGIQSLNKPGIVFNVLRTCQDSPLDDSSVDSLERALVMLEQNKRLWDEKMRTFAMLALSKTGRPERVEALLHRKFAAVNDKNARLLEAPVGTLDEASCRTAKDYIWYYLNKLSDKKEGAEQALSVLARLLEEQNGCSERSILQKGIVFNVLRACRQQGTSSVDKIEYVLNLLEQQKSLWDAKILTEVLVAMVKCSDKAAHAPERAEFILTRTNIPLNNYHFCAVLNGYAKTGKAKKAEQLLKRMEDLHRADLLEDGPNTVAHNSVLDALSKTNESNAVARAEAILRKMSKSHTTHLHPDMFTYNSMLNVYAINGEGEKAEKLLDDVVDLQKTGKLSAGPNSYTYRIVIDALAKSGNGSRAEQLLHRMHKFAVRPNKFHYTGVLSGYAREGKTADAERLLQEMLQAYTAGYLEDAPSVVAYNCAMHAWANSGEVDAPFRARALFNHMMETGVTPNVITYNCLLCACGNQGKAKETERLLKQMHDLYDAGKLEAPPNTISYNCALDALARSGDRVWTVLRAESLVNKMNDLHQTTKRADIKPNMITYRSLLRCYANWKLLEDAEKLLERMQSLHEMKKLEYGPDRQSYQVVILALEKSDEKDAPERAAKLKQKVESIYGEGGWQQETLIEIDQVGALLEYMND